MGKVVLVGAGPGEYDLLTIGGEKALRQAQCIVYDRLINPDLLDIARPDCEKIFVGKMNHNHTLTQDGINELLAEKVRKYEFVVRLKGGDPYVFGRGGEEALFLRERGIDVEVIPGISSSIAALETAGIPATHRGLSKGFQVITAHSRKDEAADIDYDLLRDKTVTLVFLMGLSHVGEIASGLINAGRDENTPAAVVSGGTTNHQKKVVGTLKDIGQKVINSGIESPAIIVVGDVVSLNSDLDFFEKRPLFGKKYLLPVIRGFQYSYERGGNASKVNRLKEMLTEKGAEVVTVETGVIAPVKLDSAFLSESRDGDYIVFTSANGVKVFFWNLDALNMDVRRLSGFRFAVIGENTAETLRSFGIRADLISDIQNGIHLAETINNAEKDPVTINWFTTHNSSEGFAKTLRPDFRLKRIVCYENDPTEIEVTPSLAEEIRSCDGVIYTSGSNAEAVIPVFKDYLPDEIYSIGEACSSKIRKMGGVNIRQAEVSSYKGIIELLIHRG